MAGPAFTKLRFHGSTTWSIPLTIEKNGSALSLAGATVTAKLRKEIDDSAAVATFSCSVTSAAAGRCQGVLSAATTGALTYDSSATGEWEPTLFWADFLITLADATVIGPVRFLIEARKAASR